MMKSIYLPTLQKELLVRTKDVAVMGSVIFVLLEGQSTGSKLFRNDDNGDGDWTEVTLPSNKRIHRIKIIMNRSTGDKNIIALFGAEDVEGVYTLKAWATSIDNISWTSGIITTDTVESEVASVSEGYSNIFVTLYASPSGGNERKVFWSTLGTPARITTWESFEFANTQVNTHVHCVWANPEIKEVYVSCGDSSADQGSARSGVLKSMSSNYQAWNQIYKERPGERIVPITANQRKRFFGIEGESGGAITTRDNNNYEMVFGRQTMTLMEFDCLVAYPDGLLIAGLYSYNWLGNGHAGEIWVSDDDGVTFIRYLTGYSTISKFDRNEDFIFAGFGDAGGGHMIKTNSPFILRIPLPSRPFSKDIKQQSVSRVLKRANDKKEYLTMLPEESTYISNMGDYNNKGIIITSKGPGILTIEADVFETDQAAAADRDVPIWTTIRDVRFTKDETKKIKFEDADGFFPIIRVTNKTDKIMNISQIIAIGQM